MNKLLDILLVRHGQTKWNVEMRLQGTLDSDLTETGIFQAKKLSERLSDIEFSKVFASPSGRTMKTAELVLGNRVNPIVTDERLKEMNFGVLEGKKIETLDERFKGEIAVMHEDPEIYNPSEYNGETYKELISRTSDFLDDIVSREDGKILVVAHGMSLMAIISAINNLEIKDFWGRGLKPNVSLTMYNYSNGLFGEELFYDTSHYE
jgi:probable phosphoglycerate mutase